MGALRSRLLFWSRVVVAGATALVLLAVSGVWVASEAMIRRTWPVRPEAVRTAGPQHVAEGARLSRLYGCSGCHDDDLHGQVFSDHPAMADVYSANLTRIAARRSDAELAQAVRQGVRPDGRALWGMPSGTFSRITDAELAAVLAYVRSRPPGGREPPPFRPGLVLRLGMLAGAFPPSPEQVAQARARPPADLGPRFAAGRHIAGSVCSECHGPDLAGDPIEGGPDLRIAGAYDREAFRRLLRTGAPPGGRDLGIMSEAAREDFRLFTDAEIDALHAYLQARAGAPPG